MVAKTFKRLLLGKSNPSSITHRPFLFWLGPGGSRESAGVTKVIIYDEALILAKEITDNIQGRAADSGISLPYVASMAVQAGDGDHLEIGSLFGASAIIVAMMKEREGLKGNVVCIDPFLPRKVGYQSTAVMTEEELDEKLNSSAEKLIANAKMFGVEERIEIIQASSDPFPIKNGRRFSTAFIDGDHNEDMPAKDFVNCAKHTDHYIGIDNFEEGYPDVYRMGKNVVMLDGWELLYKNMVFVAFRKTLPPREEGIDLTLL